MYKRQGYVLTKFQLKRKHLDLIHAILSHFGLGPGRIQPGSMLDPGWIQAWIQPGSSLDPAWIQPGSSLDPAWMQPGSSLDPSCIQACIQAWIQAWIEPGSSLDPAWIQARGGWTGSVGGNQGGLGF